MTLDNDLAGIMRDAIASNPRPSKMDEQTYANAVLAAHAVSALRRSEQQQASK
jgi:hypothetical protein